MGCRVITRTVANILIDCFSAYPTKAFNDDRVLSKPDYAYEWLFFADIVGPKVYNARESSYLTYPILAFHMLFAADGAPVKEPWVTDTDPSPFTGVTASWDAFNAEKEHSSMITTVHRSLAGPRLSQTFKSQSSIIMELAPLVNRMLSPQITPVQLVVSGFHHAAVRRDSEKRMVARAIDVMDAVGVTFEKVRVEVAPGVVVGSGWAYRMDPPLDALDLYSTLSGTRDPPRYAVRQVLEQEWKRAQALKEKEAREKRMGALSEKWAPAISAAAAAKQKELPGLPKAKVKRDFFGREIVDMGDADGGGPRKKRRRAGEEEKRNVWVSFNEGFSNAVRKGIRLDELMDGLI